MSFSSDGGLCFSGCLDGAEELRGIVLLMVHGGYMKGLVRAFGGGAGSLSAHCGGLGPGHRPRGAPSGELVLGAGRFSCSSSFYAMFRVFLV
jgi:hypothetical protein